MSKDDNQKTDAATDDSTDETEANKWNDPTVPAGLAPPLPRWPLALAIFAWVGWVVFLVAMTISRQGSSLV